MMTDLFETPSKIPVEVERILYRYENEEYSYESLAKMLKEMEAIGYTFEYGLDAEPYGLRQIVK